MARIIPRGAPEGFIPLISVEGTARECGRAYGEIVLEKFPGYMRYLQAVPEWARKSRAITALFEKKAPYVLDIYDGLNSALAKQQLPAKAASRPREACTSFSVSPALTLDQTPISGQNKDTPYRSALQYIVLRMRIKAAPTILVLAYPGELLGYGMWSTGMTLFRNSLYCGNNPRGKLDMTEWGLLALSGKSVEEAGRLAKRYGLSEACNLLISDGAGRSLSVESHAGGIDLLAPRKGINTHANHPAGKTAARYEDYPDKIERANSRYRMECLWKLLNAERGKLTAQKALMCLADHSKYPRGLCRHKVGRATDTGTTAAIVAEPAKGRLHVVRGNPCCNWPVTYEF